MKNSLKMIGQTDLHHFFYQQQINYNKRGTSGVPQPVYRIQETQTVPAREMRPRELLKASSSSFLRAGC